MATRSTLLLPLIGLLASGCLFKETTEGKEGNATFSYTACLTDCSLFDNAMAAGGARTVIDVKLTTGRTYSVARSSDSEVASFTRRDNGDVDAVSGKAGTTELQLYDTRDRLVDRVTVRVNNTTQLDYDRGWPGDGPILLAETTQSFHVTTRDATDRITMGTGSVAFELFGSLEPVSTGVLGDILTFKGLAGEGKIVASCPEALVSLPIQVVDKSALTSLTATVTSSRVMTAGVVRVQVELVASSALGPVYGATCTWGTSDPSVTLHGQNPAGLNGAPITKVDFDLAKPGNFTATCGIGAATAMVELSR